MVRIQIALLRREGLKCHCSTSRERTAKSNGDLRLLNTSQNTSKRSSKSVHSSTLSPWRQRSTVLPRSKSRNHRAVEAGYFSKAVLLRGLVESQLAAKPR